MNGHTPNELGELETYEILKLQYGNSICDRSQVIGIECRDVLTKKPAQDSQNQNITCNLNNGLHCSTNNSQVCADYEVRFLCDPHSPVCVTTLGTTPTKVTATTSVYTTQVTPNTTLTTFIGTSFPTTVTPPGTTPGICKSPMGMESGEIHASMISTSTSRDENHSGTHARLNHLTSWMPSVSDKQQFIQVKFNGERKITGLVTQGQETGDIFVKSYKLKHSQDGNHWVTYQEVPNQDKIFAGNSDSKTPVTQIFKSPIRTRYIRINPQAWNSLIALRFEILGCPEDKTTTVTTSPQPTTSVSTGSTGTTPSTTYEPKCVEWDNWCDTDRPSLQKPDDLEDIDKLVSCSHHCKVPLAIECRLASPAQTPAEETGQSVHCNLETGLFCNHTETNEGICLNYEARLGCLKEIPICVTTTEPPTTPPGPPVCHPEIDTTHCPSSCPQDHFCSVGGICVLKKDCPCKIGEYIVPPGGMRKNHNCELCMCANGGPSCSTPPPCTEGHIMNYTSCNCETTTCENMEFKCSDGQCLPREKVCDGFADCQNDELNCNRTTMTTGSTTESSSAILSTNLTSALPSRTTVPTTTTPVSSTVTLTSSSPSDTSTTSTVVFSTTPPTIDGCMINSTTHAFGEVWEPDDCTLCTCLDKSNGPTLLCESETCDDCKVGETRVPIPGKCCAPCVPQGCVQNNITYKENEVFPSDNKCFTKKCVRSTIDKRFHLLETQRSCEKLETLPLCREGLKDSQMYDSDGCCRICKPVEDNCTMCSPSPMFDHPVGSIGFFNETLSSGVTCINKDTIPDLKQCQGFCQSTSKYSASAQLISDCNCCAPSSSLKKSVKLTCSNGSQFIKTFDMIESCNCNPCSAN